MKKINVVILSLLNMTSYAILLKLMQKEKQNREVLECMESVEDFHNASK